MNERNGMMRPQNSYLSRQLNLPWALPRRPPNALDRLRDRISEFSDFIWNKIVPPINEIPSCLEIPKPKTTLKQLDSETIQKLQIRKTAAAATQTELRIPHSLKRQSTGFDNDPVPKKAKLNKSWQADATKIIPISELVRPKTRSAPLTNLIKQKYKEFQSDPSVNAHFESVYNQLYPMAQQRQRQRAAPERIERENSSNTCHSHDSSGYVSDVTSGFTTPDQTPEKRIKGGEFQINPIPVMEPIITFEPPSPTKITPQIPAATPPPAFTTPTPDPKPATSLFPPTIPKAFELSKDKKDEEKEQVEVVQITPKSPDPPKEKPTPSEALPPVEISPTPKDPSNPFLTAPTAKSETAMPQFKYTFSSGVETPVKAEPPAPSLQQNSSEGFPNSFMQTPAQNPFVTAQTTPVSAPMTFPSSQPMTPQVSMPFPPAAPMAPQQNLPFPSPGQPQTSMGQTGNTFAPMSTPMTMPQQPPSSMPMAPAPSMPMGQPPTAQPSNPFMTAQTAAPPAQFGANPGGPPGNPFAPQAGPDAASGGMFAMGTFKNKPKDNSRTILTAKRLKN